MAMVTEYMTLVRERDAKIARWLGYDDVHEGQEGRMWGTLGYLRPEESGEYYFNPHIICRSSVPLPYFTEDMNRAWQVIEKVKSMDKDVQRRFVNRLRPIGTGWPFVLLRISAEDICQAAVDTFELV